MKETKPKKITIVLIKRTQGKATVKLRGKTEEIPLLDPYDIMDALIGAHHEHLLSAEIAIAWRVGWKADKDGIVRLGQVRKASELDKELHAYDFVILLNQEAWDVMPLEKKRAVMDHELSHCQACYDEYGEQNTDENGRLLWRTRKHDISEFTAVVQRHGCYRNEIEEFVKRALEAKEQPLFAQAANE
jgi:hypothetical protein